MISKSSALKDSTTPAPSPLSVALYQPSIPPNTGNIGRLCVGFDVPLFLIKPLGFQLDEATRKRAGLDYWDHLNYKTFDDFEGFYKKMDEQKSRIIVLSKFSDTLLYDFSFQVNDILLMGNENQGVPHELTEKYQLERIKIPILGKIRSYNLANATAMALYESYRQLRWGEKKS